jgi:predicted metal-dependent hydrolase
MRNSAFIDASNLFYGDEKSLGWKMDYQKPLVYLKDKCKIVRSKRKTIALTVTPEANLVIRAPFKTPLNYINELIEKNLSWINKKIQEIKSRPPVAAKNFIDGENFLYLGDTYKLKIVDKAKKLFSFEDEFILDKNYQPIARNLFINWYKKEAKKVISQRVRFYSKITGLKYKKIRITNANSRWGSCSAKSNLNFTWRLIMAPLLVIDYVVIHELVHLEQRNHSQKFWQKVKTILPDYKTSNKWLKNNGYLLKI